MDDPGSIRDGVVDSGCVDDSDATRPELVVQPFDAFNAKTWNLGPPTAPWYQTRQAMATAAAASLAAVALVASAVLLAFRGQSNVDVIPLVENSSTVMSSEPNATITAASKPPPDVAEPPSPSINEAPPTDVPAIVRTNNNAPRQTNRPKRTPVKLAPTHQTVRATPAPAPGR